MARTPYTLRKDFEKELAPFDPNRKDYSARELELYANMLLREDRIERPQGPRILFQEHIEPDWRREVHAKDPAANGVVDPVVTRAQSRDGQTLFNRQHPEGRRVNSKHQRKANGASYYR